MGGPRKVEDMKKKVLAGRRKVGEKRVGDIIRARGKRGRETRNGRGELRQRERCAEGKMRRAVARGRSQAL